MNSNSNISESQLLSGLRAGDESALRLLFDRYYPLLLGDIYRIIPDEDTCKDLAQEVFVELWRKRNELEIHTSVQAYLRRAGINRALNFLKVNRRTVLDEPENWLETMDDTAINLQAQDKQENLELALHRAIEQLPEKCRLVFSLSRFERLSHREIADELGISVKTIENQITKAMRLLREALVKHGNLSPAIILALNWWWIK